MFDANITPSICIPLIVFNIKIGYVVLQEMNLFKFQAFHRILISVCTEKIIV